MAAHKAEEVLTSMALPVDLSQRDKLIKAAQVSGRLGAVSSFAWRQTADGVSTGLSGDGCDDSA